ncbi:MAG: beta-ketoacyl-ACP synthase [Deltaproteobacteria bacterium]|nr:beta-ketoacyl-ACP synthase [Deltaproteobacteria bacterium]
MRRVVVTGMSGISPLGNDWETIERRLRAGESGVTTLPRYDEFDGLKTKLAGKVEEGPLPAHYDRKRLRGMSRGALLAVRASEAALAQARLLDRPDLADRIGVAYGSCLGGAEMLMRLGGAWSQKNTRGILASSYVQVLSHCCAANVSLFFHLRGRMYPTCSACTSGSQAIGYSYESIRSGYTDVMVAGGAEELCVGLTGLFDAMGAASTKNEAPSTNPRPFDSDRDGLVVSEGAGTIVLEALDHAQSRGVPILAEVVGFGTNCDGSHITNPEPMQMRRAMEMALTDARLSPSSIGYVHAHATGTELGDIAESQATAALFGNGTPVGATKSFQGHTLGATGALETWLTLEMQRSRWFAPIKNLENVDPRCGDLDYLRGAGRSIDTEHVMVNNFAFGGVNTSLIFRAFPISN